jgi:hypothetical protein
LEVALRRGWPVFPLLLPTEIFQRHDVGRPKPTVFAAPGCSGEQVPIFFGKYYAPKEGLILLGIAFQDHRALYIETIKTRKIILDTVSAPVRSIWQICRIRAVYLPHPCGLFSGMHMNNW